MINQFMYKCSRLLVNLIDIISLQNMLKELLEGLHKNKRLEIQLKIDKTKEIHVTEKIYCTDL